MQKLYKSFIEFQKEFKGMTPDATNPFFKSNYITLDGILEVTRPLLVKNGLAIMQNAFSDNDGNMCLKTILLHESGESLETEIMKMKPQKDDAQQRGSIITYMKRYQLGALLGICESVDDDANIATYGVNNHQNNSPNNITKPLSDAQLKRLYAIASSAGVDKNKVQEQVFKKFGKDVVNLTKSEYDIVCTGYEKARE
ncbi:ERF family protein [Faecalimicrobium sp. JNUCC 81]